MNKEGADNELKTLIISSGYYGLDEYMKEENNLYALLVCSEKMLPLEFSFKERIYFSFDSSPEGIVETIRKIDTSFDYLMCIDDKFMNSVNYIKSELNIKSFLLDGAISRDKYILKQLMDEVGINYPKTLKVSDWAELLEKESAILYPVVVKPSNSYGSNSVYLVESKTALLKYAKNIFNRNRFQTKFYGDANNLLLVEEYINGKEFAVDIIWNNGLPKNKMISSRLHAKNTIMFPDYVYYYDCKLDAQKQNAIYDLAESVGRMIGIKNGATHTEIREKEGKLYVLENAVRPGGGGCMYELHRYHTNQNYFKNYCNVMKNETIEFENNSIEDGRYYFFMTYANENSGIVKDVFFDNSKLDKNIEVFKVEYLVKKGDRILPVDSTMRYTIFVFGAISADSEERFKIEIEKVNDACRLDIE